MQRTDWQPFSLSLSSLSLFPSLSLSLFLNHTHRPLLAPDLVSVPESARAAAAAVAAAVETLETLEVAVTESIPCFDLNDSCSLPTMAASSEYDPRSRCTTA